MKRTVRNRASNSIANASTTFGNIDKVEAGRLYGWIKYHNTDEPVAIDLYVNNNLVTSWYVANVFRPDLAEAGMGGGYNGFEIPMHDVDLSFDEVEFSVRAAGGSIELLNMTTQTSFDGRIDILTEDHLRGWAVNPFAPSSVFSVDIFIDGEFFCTLRNDGRRNDLKSKGLSEGLGGFDISLPLGFLNGGEHTVSLRLPNGRELHRSISVAQRHPSISLTTSAVSPRPVSVIVPVYNAADDVEVCIERLKTYTSSDVPILFINDASTDPRIASLLDVAAREPNMQVLHNDTNLGFTRTINLGLTETGRSDVIILNSDARVTPGWLEGMAFAARSEPSIATVTAMSDRAGAFSAPNAGNDNVLPVNVDEPTYARAFRRHSLGLYPKVPTGNGFCMYISRACIDEIGPLDAEAFPRGYGEENDFCMRAQRAGWRHVIDDRTYVFHDRSKSFGEAKTELMSAGRKIIDQRYPEYKKAIQVFSNDGKIMLARLRAKHALAACRNNTELPLRILFVVSTQTGGTPQTNKDLMTGLSDAVDGWILRCDSKMLELRQMIDGEDRVHRTHILAEPVDPISHRSMEYEAVVTAWLLELDADIVHIRHLGWHSLMLPKIAKNLGQKVLFSFHDFYTLCPTVKLLDGDNGFCGGSCTSSERECRAELWPEGSLPPLKNQWVHHWRDRFAAALEPCDGFITTSHSAHQRIAAALPSVPVDRFAVIPHGRDFDEFQRLRQLPMHGQPIRILVPGHINAAKGRNIILTLLEHDKEELLEIHIMGKLSMEGAPKPARLILHGDYARDSFAAVVSSIQPHVGAIFSIWDETYCHTLTELWSAGIPAMVFDFPTVANRVRESGAGWVLDHTDTEALYDEILRIAFNEAEQREKDEALARWQAGDGAYNTIRRMAADYLGLYKNVLNRTEGPIMKTAVARISVVCPANADQVRANGSTFIRIWERTRNTLGREPVYIRMGPQELLANLRNRTIDGAILQRTAIPATMVTSLLDSFRESNIPYLFDIDDDLLNVPPDKDPTGKYASYASKLTAIAANAARVTTSTATLAARLSQINPNVTILPNRLSNRLWQGDLNQPEPDGKIRALYMGTNTHVEDLRMVLPALDEVALAEPEFELVLIGMGVPAEELAQFGRKRWLSELSVPPEAVRYDKFVPWLQSQAGNFDFGIAPLVDTPFNNYKSSLKALDYGALGLPCLISDVEIYRPIAKSAPSGIRLVGNSVKQWVEALNERIEEASKHGRKRDTALRQWIAEYHMLDDSLADFDELVLGTIGIRSSDTAGPESLARTSAPSSLKSRMKLRFLR